MIAVFSEGIFLKLLPHKAEKNTHLYCPLHLCQRKVTKDQIPPGIIILKAHHTRFLVLLSNSLF